MSISSLSSSCAICFDELSPEASITRLHSDPKKIAHIFHKACLDKWLIKKPSCPVCREPVPEELIPAPLPSLLQAVETGNLAVITALFDQAHSETMIEKSLSLAAKRGRLDILSSLCTHLDVSHQIRSLAFVKAAKYRQLDCFMYLLSSSQLTPPSLPLALEKLFHIDYQDGLEEGAEDIQIAMLTILLNHAEFPEASISEAYTAASRQGSLALLEILTHVQPLSPLCFFSAAMEALEHHHYECLKYIISHSLIECDSAQEIAYHAVQSAPLEIVDYIMQAYPFSEQSRGVIVKGTCIWGDLDIFQLVISYGSITEHAKLEAIEMASLCGHQDLVTRLETL